MLAQFNPSAGTQALSYSHGYFSIFKTDLSFFYFLFFSLCPYALVNKIQVWNCLVNCWTWKPDIWISRLTCRYRMWLIQKTWIDRWHKNVSLLIGSILEANCKLVVFSTHREELPHWWRLVGRVCGGVRPAVRTRWPTAWFIGTRIVTCTDIDTIFETA